MLVLFILLSLLYLIIYNIARIIGGLIYRYKINNLIEAINSTNDLLEISTKDLTNLTMEIYRRKGFKVKPTDKCGEFGNGIIINDLQFCEIYKSGLNKQMEVETAMKLSTNMRYNGIYRGLLVTLGNFKQNTKLYCHKNVIECINGEQLLSMLLEAKKPGEVLQT